MYFVQSHKNVYHPDSDISHQISGSEIMVHGILERVVPRPSQDSTRSEEIYTELRHGFPFPLS